MKPSQEQSCHFSASPAFTLGSCSPTSLPAPHGIFLGSEQCFCLRRATAQQQENTRWIMKANTYSVSHAREGHRLRLGNGSTAFVCLVKADETTLSSQEAARPQQNKNKETMRLCVASVSGSAHISHSETFCLKYLGLGRNKGYAEILPLHSGAETFCVSWTY